MNNVLKSLWTKRRYETGNILLMTLVDQFGEFVAVSDLTEPVMLFRLRTSRRAEAVQGLGLISDYEDTLNVPPIYNAQYVWDALDPNVEGVYLYEIDATDGDGNSVTFPSSAEPFMLRIIEDVGG